jgi:hypothetical protein
MVYEFVGEASLSNVFANFISVSSVVAPTGTARKTVGPLILVFEVVALAA